jgi:hypothetical protein
MDEDQEIEQLAEGAIDLTKTITVATKPISHMFDHETGWVALTLTDDAARELWGELGNALQGHETS